VCVPAASYTSLNMKKKNGESLCLHADCATASAS